MKIKDLCIINPKNINKNFTFINYIDTSSVVDGSLVDVQYLTNKYPSRAKRELLNKDILISSVRPNLKHNYYVHCNYANLVGSTGFIQIRVNSNKIHPKYLYYFLTSSKQIETYTSVAETSQTTFPSFNKDVIENIYFPDITFEEQQHIVNTIGSVDNLIEIKTSLIEKIWNKINLEYIKEFNDIHNLNGNNIVTLNDVCIRFATGLNPRSNFKLGNGDNFYVTIKNYETGKLYLNDKCDKVDNEAIIKINSRSDLRKGDVLFSGIGTIGRTYLISETPMNWNISESIFTIRASERISPEFLYLLLVDNDMQTYSRDNASGSVQKGIRMADIKAYKFNLPSIEKIHDFTKNVRPLFNLILSIEGEINILNNLKQQYLKKFFG